MRTTALPASAKFLIKEVECSTRTHVDSDSRFVKNVQIDVLSERFAKQDLLLIAT